MEKSDMNVLMKRWETWELGMLVHLHLRSAESATDDKSREENLQKAKVYHEVLLEKIRSVQNT